MKASLVTSIVWLVIVRKIKRSNAKKLSNKGWYLPESYSTGYQDGWDARDMESDVLP